LVFAGDWPRPPRCRRGEAHAAALLAQLIHPLGQTPGGLVGRCGRHAEALQIDKAANALGPRARIHAGDIAAHAVADQVDGLIGRDLLQQHVQVGQVVGEVVAVAGLGAAAQAEAAPVVGNDAAALHKGVAEGVDHKLVGGGHIHPAMGQHQHGQSGSIPEAGSGSQLRRW
jgi:hypothetical protein